MSNYALRGRWKGIFFACNGGMLLFKEVVLHTIIFTHINFIIRDKKKMSINQRKLVTNLKEYFSKVGFESSVVMFLLSKECMKILKKASFMTSHLEAATLEMKKNSDSKSESGTKSSGTNEGSGFLSNSLSDLPMKITDLKLKFSQRNDFPKEEKTKWKPKKNVVSELSIHARTKHILSSILAAESESSRLQRLESLVEHFLQYPDGVLTAVKCGAVPRLILLRENNDNEMIAEVIREALTILGYTDPLPKRGIRILSIDGGGIRGLLVMEMLEKLEELTGSKVHEIFDYICGVSTGSVIACTIGASGKSIRDISNLYRELSNKIFTQNAFFGARSLIWNHGYYDTGLWEELLKEHVGVTQLIKTTRKKGCPKVAAISTVSQDDHVTPFIFRNYELPYRINSQYPGSYRHQLWEAARASAAAPTYFEEFRLGDFLHQDGGILVNNPTAVAIHEAKQLWPKSPVQCVVSFGTGRTDLTLANLKQNKKATVKQTSWKEKFSNILVSATDTEAVHVILNDLLPPSVYFRFNPYVTELLSMDEYQPEKLAAMQKDAHMYIRRNEEKFQEAASALMQEKTVYQKLVDWATVKAIIYKG